MQLQDVTNNLNNIVERYANVPLIETKELSEILRDLGSNLSYLVQLRKHYYHTFQKTVYSSDADSTTAKIKEAERKVPELDYIRKVLTHYGELRKDIRTQISLWKNND